MLSSVSHTVTLLVALSLSLGLAGARPPPEAEATSSHGLVNARPPPRSVPTPSHGLVNVRPPPRSVPTPSHGLVNARPPPRSVPTPSHGLVNARPPPRAVAPPSQELTSRGPNEALYLANCYVQSGRNTDFECLMAYYSNGKSGSQNGEQPNDTGIVSFQSTGFTYWEGNSRSAQFNSGATATSNIRSDAANYQTGQYAGSARNSYGQNFNCYKDNHRKLFHQENSGGSVYTDCYSIYYCFDA